MMALAVVALALPAVFALGDETIRPTEHDIERLSDGMAIVMIVIYALYLLFTLCAAPTPPNQTSHEHGPPR